MKTELLERLKSIEAEINNQPKMECYLDFNINRLVVKNETEFTALVSHRFLLHNAIDLFKHVGNNVKGNEVVSFYDIVI